MSSNRLHRMSERGTRRGLIDRKIEQAGWGPFATHEGGREYQNESVVEYNTENGPADYVLFHQGRPLALVEAKKLTVGPQNVLKQAQRYARGFPAKWWDFDGFHVPFIYSTNGEVIWFQDLRHRDSRSREVKHFHTPQALQELLAQDRTKSYKWLSTEPSAGKERLRPYQREAVNSVENALIGGKRLMMVAMATGTGKTFMAISLLYRLMKSGFARSEEPINSRTANGLGWMQPLPSNIIIFSSGVHPR